MQEIAFCNLVIEQTTRLCDNKSAISLSKENMLHQRRKHIEIRYQFSREAQEKKLISVNYIPTDKNIADVLTKALSKDKRM